MARQVRAAVAASAEWLDPDDNVRLPAGDVHAWLPGTNQTLCGLALAKSGLARFAHVPFEQVLPGPPPTGRGQQQYLGLTRCVRLAARCVLSRS